MLRRPPSGIRGYIGVALILLAVAILASAFSEPGVIWAIVLIAFGVFLFRQDDPAEAADRRPPPGGGPGPGAIATTTPLPAASPATTTTEPLGPPPAPGQGAIALPPDVPVWEPPPPPPDRAAAWGAPPPRRPRRRPFLGPLTFAVALIVTGLALVLNNMDVLDLSLGQVLAVFLTVLGGGLLVGTWWGRAWGLIPVGLLAVPVVALTALAGPVPVEGGVAERLFQPTTPAEVRSPYRLAGGELILDLSKVDFGPGAPPVEASVAGGRVLVVLPDEVAADVRGRVGVGAVDLLDHVEQRRPGRLGGHRAGRQGPGRGRRPHRRARPDGRLRRDRGPPGQRPPTLPGGRPVRGDLRRAHRPRPGPDHHGGTMTRRHELDPISLTFGFAFTGLGLLFLLGRADQALRLQWVWPLLLLALGAGILFDVIRGRGRPDPEVDPGAPLPDPEADPAPEATVELEPASEPDR